MGHTAALRIAAREQLPDCLCAQRRSGSCPGEEESVGGRPDKEAAGARKAIEDLLINHVEAPCGLVTISIGVESLVPDHNQPASDLVEAADRALYTAKRRGRNMVVAHIPMRLSAAS